MKVIEFLPEDQASVESRNWVLAIDCSGSMGWTLDELARHVMHEIRKVPVGDTITVGWFSGVGYFGWIVKGMQIVNDRSYQIVDQAIQNNMYTRNTTCFSEILGDLEQVVKDLAPFGDTFNLLFFTDGCPVVPSVTAEIAAIERAITGVAGKLSATLFIGYGGYYNRRLMADMAAWAGGALVHSRDLDATQRQIDEFMSNGLKSSGRVEIMVDGDAEIAFAVSGNQVVTLNIPDDYKVSAPAGTRVWVLTEEVKVGNVPAVDIAAQYAAAAALVREGQLGNAMEILGKIGDKHLIDKVDSAYVMDDIADAEAGIVAAAVDERFRFRDGKVENYVPDPNVTCLLDVIEMLAADPVARFYPQHKEWKYSRIGPKMVKEKRYPKFRPDNDGCPFSDLTWNAKKLNLSVRAQTQGTILLGNGAAKHMLPGAFPTHKFNNYALVFDGRCNVPVVPMSFSKETYDEMVCLGMVNAPWISEEAVYLVDMTKVPVMNRAIAKGYTSGKDVVNLVIEAYELRARQKVLGYYYDEATAGKQVAVKGYTPEQSKFLATKGINRRGGYAPPKEKVDPVDFYEVNTFEIKVRGLSSLPKVAAVMDRVEEMKDPDCKKKLTTSMQLIADALTWYEQLENPDDGLAEWIDEKRRSVRAQIRDLDSEVARAKFAVIMGKSWFEDVERTDPVIEVDGYTVTFAEGRQRIDI